MYDVILWSFFNFLDVGTTLSNLQGSHSPHIEVPLVHFFRVSTKGFLTDHWIKANKQTTWYFALCTGKLCNRLPCFEAIRHEFCGCVRELVYWQVNRCIVSTIAFYLWVVWLRSWHQIFYWGWIDPQLVKGFVLLLSLYPWWMGKLA